MSQQFFVKPAPGRKPRNLDTTRRIAPTGELINDTPANRRLLINGDLLMAVQAANDPVTLRSGLVIDGTGQFVFYSPEILAHLGTGHIVSRKPVAPVRKQSTKTRATPRKRSTH